MIHVREIILGEDTMEVRAEGVLDERALPVLEEVCRRHLRARKRVLLDLSGIIHVTREGRSFLKGVRKPLFITALPEMLKPWAEP